MHGTIAKSIVPPFRAGVTVLSDERPSHIGLISAIAPYFVRFNAYRSEQDPDTVLYRMLTRV